MTDTTDLIPVEPQHRELAVTRVLAVALSADIEAHQTIVTTTLMANSSVKPPKKARWEARS